MDVIRSQDNNLVKTAVKLKQRKYRYKYGKFVLEGYRIIKDTLALGKTSNNTVIVAESKFDEYASEFEDVVVVADSIFERMSETISSQGIIMLTDMLPFKQFVDSDYCLYLDRIRDPGNLGTIIRSAAACGFYDIILDDCVDVYNPKTVRSSMSTFALCNFIQASKGERVVGKDYTIICADADGVDLYSAGIKPASKKICLIIGNEAEGVSDELRSRADMTVALPMSGGVESLNAAVSASVMMYGLRYFKHKE